jgi:hypothetical protein
VLTAIRLALTVAGPLLVSSRLAEPNYDVKLAWNPEALPPDTPALLRLQLDPLPRSPSGFRLFLAALIAV